MIDFDGKELKEEFNRVFASNATTNPITKTALNGLKIENLTVEQLWWLTKFAKHVRGRCRNNSAFNNYMNRNFAPARFSEVPKEYQGKIYKGLKIEVAGQSIEDKDE